LQGSVRAGLSIAAMLACCVQGALADSLSPERRRSQFSSESGYYLFPYPYSYPGLGEGLALVGAAANIGGTYLDAAAAVFTGDVKGGSLGISDLHILRERLIVDLGGVSVSEVQLTSYAQRGMNGDKNDYTLLQYGDSAFGGGRLTATFGERRYELYAGVYGGVSRLEAVRDRDGELILDIVDPQKSRSQTRVLGARMDLTDDYYDPRKGLRFDASLWHSPPRESWVSDYYARDLNVTGYVPVGRRSTWAFNYFRSDAVVTRRGETDPNVVVDRTGLRCETITDPASLAQCQAALGNVVANNVYGTATSLGGPNRLRSYPVGRFTGAHTVFYGTELRWNLTDEYQPFDLVIVKDVRTSFQLVAFYELGSVADERDELGKTFRSSYGAGFRIVTASGLVLRADVARGREGSNLALWFQYPWEM
jgi:hypothetical protein